MNYLDEKFRRLGVENAPGQEVRQTAEALEYRGDVLAGPLVDFSHGDVDAFEPIPGTLDAFIAGVNEGGCQAYTEYRGKNSIREDAAAKLSRFMGAGIGAEDLIITPGTQGALFLAAGATFSRGDKVAIVLPDYFANRKLVEFFDCELVPIELDYFGPGLGAGIDLGQLEKAFQKGVKVFLFSNPNNPTGVVYSPDEIKGIANLAQRYGVTLIVDELYSRQIFEGKTFTHLFSQNIVEPDNIITIIGPSKTESLSGYRLGVAFGSSKIIGRMEKLQAIVSLRAAGYCQAVMRSWFSEPAGWMEERIHQHQVIRDELLARFRAAEGFEVRATEAGSYLFPRLPELDLTVSELVKILRLQANVIVTPGTEFGSLYNDSFRINFSQDRRAAINGIERLIQIVDRYRA